MNKLVPELTNDKRCYTVEEVMELLGIGKTSAYNLCKKDYFNIVRIGTSIRISKKSFDNWLDTIAV